MGMPSLEVLRNKFNIYRMGDEFILNRETSESISPEDFIRLYESLCRDEEHIKKKLKEIQKQKEVFEKHIEKAKKMKEVIRNERHNNLKKLFRNKEPYNNKYQYK